MLYLAEFLLHLLVDHHLCELNCEDISLHFIAQSYIPFAMESEDFMTSESDSLLLPIKACTFENTPSRAK